MDNKKMQKLKRTVEKNTTITKKVSREEPEVIKEGVPLDHNVKHDPKGSDKTVGVSFGTTLNMGDYESLRIDAWLCDTVEEDETQEEALTRLASIATKFVEEVAQEYKG